jgi:hypothetical protein
MLYRHWWETFSWQIILQPDLLYCRGSYSWCVWVKWEWTQLKEQQQRKNPCSKCHQVAKLFITIIVNWGFRGGGGEPVHKCYGSVPSYRPYLRSWQPFFYAVTNKQTETAAVMLSWHHCDVTLVSCFPKLTRSCWGLLQKH